VRRRGFGFALLLNDLRTWSHYRLAWACLGIAVATVVLHVTGSTGHALFREALGGPTVVRLGGQLRMGAGWTWLLTGVLFVVSTTVLFQPLSPWIQLTLVRGVTPRAWVAARLGALAVGASIYLATLLATMVVVMLVGHPGPLIRAATGWDVGLWLLGLVALGWFSMALVLVTNTAWPALVTPLVLLGMARFGGNAAPYIPFAQWIIGLHGLPGTLTVAAGAGYVLVWTLLSGAAAVRWAAHVTAFDHS